MVVISISRFRLHREEISLWGYFSVRVLLVDEAGGEQCDLDCQEEVVEFYIEI